MTDSMPEVEDETACDQTGSVCQPLSPQRRFRAGCRRAGRKAKALNADGKAKALTARRRIRKSGMSGVGCLFKDRDRFYTTKLLRIAFSLHP